MSYAWKNKDQHINVLEMVAVLDLLRKLSRNSKGHESRLVVLVDNQPGLFECAHQRPILGQSSAIASSTCGCCDAGLGADRLLWLGEVKVEPSGWTFALGIPPSSCLGDSS
jgi:hypothetical protein